MFSFIIPISLLSLFISPLMGSSFFIFTTIFLALISGFSCSDHIAPNFTASYLGYIENHGAFLFSTNGTFKAAVYNPGNQQTNFYLCIVHVASNTVVWSANRDAPISNSGRVMLSSDGLIVSDEYGNKKWSTPRLHSSVSALTLSDIGNLLLLDQNNVSLWDSFDYPSDTIVMGQKLPVGNSLISSVSDNDLSTGNYSLSITTSDAMLQWDGMAYWILSMNFNVHRNSNFVVEYLVVDRNGLYLRGSNGSIIVLQVKLSPSDFRIARLSADGQFIVSSYSGGDWKQEFVGPDDICRAPVICGRIGLCTILSNRCACSCPPGFRADVHQRNGCIPNDSSVSLPSACNSSSDKSSVDSKNVSYLSLGAGKDYFAIKFLDPVKLGIDLSDCQDLCSADCSCLGFFYRNSSASCFIIRNQLGSILSNADGNDQLGYIKTLVAPDPTDVDINGSKRGRQLFPLVALVIFPITGLSLAAALGFLCWRKLKNPRVQLEKSDHLSSPSSGELEAFSIPGLPVRYNYEVLRAATDDFRTQIGSGGFGAVYKGTLSDNTVVAVKKITNLSVQGKKDFCTEIAIIGNIHHVNLVKLKGFCAQGSQRLLVYEFMNRGSLDRTLFGSGPVLEWQERFDIALGTARGLAYLHSGCERKIIHCDVKPENILLHDHFHPKISDFGLSKLLGPEQSSHFTTMRGTRGYLAPEWLTSSAISEKTDVYSYGMVLLELVSGRKNCLSRQQSHNNEEDNSTGNISSNSSGSGCIYFPMLALEMHEQGRYLELADPRLEGRVTNEEVEKLVRVALCCVHEEPALRPNMVTVVAMLEGKLPLGYPRLESLNFLRFYGRRFSEPSVMEESDQQSDFMVYNQINASVLSTRGTVLSPLSYVSSQQISGPR